MRWNCEGGSRGKEEKWLRPQGRRPQIVGASTLWEFRLNLIVMPYAGDLESTSALRYVLQYSGGPIKPVLPLFKMILTRIGTSFLQMVHESSETYIYNL